MRNFKLLGIIALVAVIVFATVGCGSLVAPSYYNLGDVSEEDCALIQVNNILTDSGAAFSNYTDYVSIDGQGGELNNRLWKGKKIPGLSEGDAIVRVTPGTYTFTGKIRRTRESNEVPISVTYDVKAGKGYSFLFDGVADNPRAVVMKIREYDLDEKGNFKYSRNDVAGETAWLW